MTARILIVDDIEINVKLLQAKLMAEYFEVLTASNGPDAIELCRQGRCDVVLLDVMMPGMDGFEVCRRLKSDAMTAHLPVVMVTALDQISDRIQGLESGADDFLTKPLNDLALITRVKSLARLKMVTDELQLRVSTSRDMGIDEMSLEERARINGNNGRILLVDDPSHARDKLRSMLEIEHTVDATDDAQEALFNASDGDYDMAAISASLQGFDALRLCSQLRSLDHTRMLPILLVAEEVEDADLIRAIDLGVNDYISRPTEPNELLARTRTQVKRKRLNDRLRQSVQATMEMAVKDALTGLHNRRYFDRHAENMLNTAIASGKTLSLIVLDIDHFKSVNDTYGHQAGDDVLRTFAQRISNNVRSRDLACRFGGEEFVVMMPDTDQDLAVVVADRMRRETAEEPFVTKNDGREISATVSAGVASLSGKDDTVNDMLKRADEALYLAKRKGRNQVIASAA